MKSSIVALAAAVFLFSGQFHSSAHAAKEVFQRTHPHVNVGTIGHVDRSNDKAQQDTASGVEPIKRPGQPAANGAQGDRTFKHQYNFGF